MTQYTRNVLRQITQGLSFYTVVVETVGNDRPPLPSLAILIAIEAVRLAKIILQTYSRPHWSTSHTDD